MASTKQQTENIDSLTEAIMALTKQHKQQNEKLDLLTDGLMKVFNTEEKK
jgi:uncharacterized coiled-coil protein SlyX